MGVSVTQGPAVIAGIVSIEAYKNATKYDSLR
jgi:hypothetical protein